MNYLAFRNPQMIKSAADCLVSQNYFLPVEETKTLFLLKEFSYPEDSAVGLPMKAS